MPATCKADLTQNCCGCENVSPDGRCGTWTSVCFMCTGTVAEDACPEACAFDIFKWRTGIDFLDEPLVSHGPSSFPPLSAGVVPVRLAQMGCATGYSRDSGQERLDNASLLANKLGVDAAPTAFVNGKEIPGVPNATRGEGRAAEPGSRLSCCHRRGP